MKAMANMLLTIITARVNKAMKPMNIFNRRNRNDEKKNGRKVE